MTPHASQPGINDLTSDMLDQLYARLEKAELKAEAMTAAMQSTATDALKHRGCHMKLMAQCIRAEKAEATLTAVRAIAEELIAEGATEHGYFGDAGRRIRVVLDQSSYPSKEDER